MPSSNSFNEKDPHDTGWALKVKGGDADSVETLVGVRFGGFWDMAGGMFRPEVMVAWAHEFDDPAEVDMAFREAPDAKFTVVASDVSDDSLVAGVGGTFDVTNQLRFGIKWDGRFNEDYDFELGHRSDRIQVLIRRPDTKTAGSPYGLPMIFRSVLRVVSHSPSMESVIIQVRRIVKCSPKLSLRHLTALFQQVRSFVEGCRQAMARCLS